MKISKRKQDQFERFSSSDRLQQRLSRGKKDYSHSSAGDARVHKVNLMGDYGYIKIHKGEELQKKNIDSILQAYEEGLKNGQIKGEGYILGPNPYIFSLKNFGVMRSFEDLNGIELGDFELYSKVGEYHWLGAKGKKVLYTKEPLGDNYEKIDSKVKKLGLSKKSVGKAVENFYNDRKILVANNPHLFFSGPSNYKFLGFNEDGKIIIGLIDQMEPERFLDEEMEKTLKRMNNSEEKDLTSKLSAIIGITGIGAGLFFLSNNITGNVIGNLTIQSSNIIGLSAFLIGLIGAFFYFKKK